MQKQCKKCPWRVGVDPLTIPHGYCELKHQGLKSTIATPGELPVIDKLEQMACHESPIGKDHVCIGWLHNQLNEGNNILLRLKVHLGQVDGDYELLGEQHPTFEDTLPQTSSLLEGEKERS